MSFTLGLVLGISIGFLLAFIPLIIFFLWYRRGIMKKVNVLLMKSIEHENISMDIDCTSQQRIQSEFEIRKKDIDIDTKHCLGIGCFSYVYLGSVAGTLGPVSIKITNPTVSHEIIHGSLNEIIIRSYLKRHENVSGFIGACTEEIHMVTQAKFCFQELVRWSEEIARGMEYISNMKVVHLDLAARNILLTVDLTVKISDFGQARKLEDPYIQNIIENEPIPWRSREIDCLELRIFSTPSDVWAYEILLWKIFSLGDEPYTHRTKLYSRLCKSAETWNAKPEA